MLTEDGHASTYSRRPRVHRLRKKTPSCRTRWTGRHHLVKSRPVCAAASVLAPQTRPRPRAQRQRAGPARQQIRSALGSSSPPRLHASHRVADRVAHAPGLSPWRSAAAGARQGRTDPWPVRSPRRPQRQLQQAPAGTARAGSGPPAADCRADAVANKQSKSASAHLECVPRARRRRAITGKTISSARRPARSWFTYGDIARVTLGWRRKQKGARCASPMGGWRSWSR
jgi:hypothetical protein